MISSTCGFALAVLLAAAGAQAQVYRWVDEKGNVYYGERPPSGVAARALEGKPATPTATPRAPSDYSSQEREFQQRRIEREQREALAERERQQAMRLKTQCDNARLELELLRETPRVITGVDEKGERQYLTDAQRDQAIKRYEAVIAERCR
jgi:hypothetical protein